MFDSKDNPPLEDFKPTTEILFGDIMSVEEYLDCVECGGIMDDDGFGHPSTDTHADERHFIYPSDGVNTIPGQSSHIVWYNR